MTMLEQRTALLTTIAALAALAGLDMTEPVLAQEGSEPSREVALVENLLWQVGTNGENVPWDEAHEYCETLELAGFDDWRLPTLVELESLHDPSSDSGAHAAIELDDCCTWSATNLVMQPAEAKGRLPDPANDLADYYWGFLFPSGDRYYSFRRFPDGLAMCVREP